MGTQYRSEIFYENEQQKNTAEKYKNFINEKLDGKIETNISKIKNYCKAEEYHQKYIMKRNQ
jgi:peptide methionine sulfoxide reductase MsrA